MPAKKQPDSPRNSAAGSGSVRPIVLPLRVQERPTTGSKKADRIIERTVNEVMARMVPVITDEIVKALQNRIDIIE